MGELFLHELARAVGREFSSSLLTEAGAMPLPSHFKSRDQTNDLTRPHAILFYQMFVPSRSLWLLKKKHCASTAHKFPIITAGCYASAW